MGKNIEDGFRFLGACKLRLVGRKDLRDCGEPLVVKAVAGSGWVPRRCTTPRHQQMQRQNCFLGNSGMLLFILLLS